jgi:hypothetical protein
MTMRYGIATPDDLKASRQGSEQGAGTFPYGTSWPSVSVERFDTSDPFVLGHS